MIYQKTIESYYQETGRAGRDGLPAKALLLYNPGDAARLRSWINTIPDENQKRVEGNKLNHMLAFAEATHCRRQILLHYFNEVFEQKCGYCDVCDNPPETTDATVDAQKLLSCIYRLRQNYGFNYIIDVLRGSDAEKIKQANHQNLSTFGIGKDKSTAYWKQLTWQLIHLNYCVQDLDHYNVLKLTKKAIPLLRGEEHISLTVQPNQLNEKTAKKKRAAPQPSNPVFALLSAVRRKLANEEDKPPFMIFSDATLHEMAVIKPKTKEELLTVSGVGQYKLKHYGQVFLAALKNAEHEMAELN